ncbi:MAG: hypothetical protein FIA95_08325 [Gemmatimonadetes bacterium]|nr:hypothetical protein [Gemmatimonadota bacterium]
MARPTGGYGSRLHFASVYILRWQPGDTMILDTAEGHEETRRRLAAFLASQEQVVEIHAAGRCQLDPAMQPLSTFRMRKTTGQLHTERLPGGILQVSGRPDLLARYIQSFAFQPGVASDHHHPEQGFMGELAPGSAHVVIEANEEAGCP